MQQKCRFSRNVVKWVDFVQKIGQRKGKDLEGGKKSFDLVILHVKCHRKNVVDSVGFVGKIIHDYGANYIRYVRCVF